METKELLLPLSMLLVLSGCSTNKGDDYSVKTYNYSAHISWIQDSEREGNIPSFLY